MSRGVRDGDRYTLGHAQEWESLQAGGVDGGFEVADPGVEGELVDFPAGQPTAALVVPDEAPMTGETLRRADARWGSANRIRRG
jgi:hypothetical protein